MKIGTGIGIQLITLDKAYATDNSATISDAEGKQSSADVHGDSVIISAEGMNLLRQQKAESSTSQTSKMQTQAGESQESGQGSSSTDTIEKMIKDLKERIAKLQEEIKEIEARQALSPEQKQALLESKQRELTLLQAQMNKLVQQKLEIEKEKLEDMTKSGGSNGGTAASTPGAAF